jgi:hypothetical protein
VSRVQAYVTPEQKVEIERRAKAHGQSVSAYLARCALGDIESVQAVPDRWWDRLPLSRRWQLRNWFDEDAKRERAATIAAAPVLPFGEGEPDAQATA